MNHKKSLSLVTAASLLATSLMPLTLLAQVTVSPVTVVYGTPKVTTSIPTGSAPVQSGITVTPGRTDTTISWQTDKADQMKLFYDSKPLKLLESTGPGISPGIAGMFVQDRTLNTGYTVDVTNLTPNTTYYYLIESIDKAGNITVTWPTTFTTKS